MNLFLSVNGSPLIVKSMFEAIQRIRDQGITVLLVEQNETMAMKVSQRAYVLELGRIVAQGEPAELMSRPEIRRAYLGL